MPKPPPNTISKSLVTEEEAKSLFSYESAFFSHHISRENLENAFLKPPREKARRKRTEANFAFEAGGSFLEAPAYDLFNVGHCSYNS